MTSSTSKNMVFASSIALGTGYKKLESSDINMKGKLLADA